MSNRFVSIYKLPITDEDIKRVVARIAAKEAKHHKDPMDPNSVQYELVDWCDSAARELNIEARCQRGGIETVISLVKVLAAIVDCVKAEATKRGHFFPGAEDDPVKEKLWAWIGQHKQHLLNLPVRTDSRKTYSDSTPEPKQGDKGRECVISTLDT